jgi:hypothetical protein
MRSDKPLGRTLCVAITLLALAGCTGTRSPARATPFRVSLPVRPSTTPTPVGGPTPTLAPMSIRGRLLDLQGRPVAGKPVALFHERDTSAGVMLEPVPQDLAAGTGGWSGMTDDRGVFVLGASADQPDIYASSKVPGNRYTLAMGLVHPSGVWDQVCSAYVLLGTVYLRESCSGDHRSQAAETLWVTLRAGDELELGIVVYVEEENSTCCQ